MIKKFSEGAVYYLLAARSTAYAIAVMPSGHLEHLYYGEKISADSADDLALLRSRREFELGNVIAYSEEFPPEIPEDECYEISSCGHGDIREPFIEAVLPDGSRTLDFRYKSDEIGKRTEPPLKTLPCSYSENGAEQLCITMADGDLTLRLYYTVYESCDVITRSAVLINNANEPIELERLMSLQLDLPTNGLCMTTFGGAWAREMNKRTTPLVGAKVVSESRAGCSSSRANPFFMIHSPDTTEDSGSCFGFNLIYSGNHYASAETNAYGKTRIVSGIQPQGMRILLKKGERFEAPEAVMTYSNKGFTGQSINMHNFVREHIVRGKWKRKPRPILLNSWEACYFNVNEQGLVSLAKAGKELGIELFVMDDGWFAKRDDDSHSLGDWDSSEKKLPKGLDGISKKITALGLQFGIWVEPEMVSVQSELYKAHPDWAMEIPGKLHSEGRHQRILDLSNDDVVNYLITKMSEVFSSGDITYVKWDMNRIFSDVFSQKLPKERQGEAAHRYICGLYRLMRELTQQFPNILFEGCASGGNRFDLGILCYFPQIWASDNTDAISRLTIQEGYSYGYPQSVVAAHAAASPNHQTLRETPLETRCAVASFGIFGVEYDVRDMTAEQKQTLAAQIERCKQWRDVLQFGQLYRSRTGNLHEWTCVSQDKKRAVGVHVQVLAEANKQSERFFAKGLDPAVRYKFYNIPARVNVKLFGSLINTMAPIHVKQDSLVHNVIAKVVKMNGEEECASALGDLLMNAGLPLSPAFSGTGFSDKVRLFPDFAARIYYMEAGQAPGGSTQI